MPGLARQWRFVGAALLVGGLLLGLSSQTPGLTQTAPTPSRTPFVPGQGAPRAAAEVGGAPGVFKDPSGANFINQHGTAWC